MKKRLDILLVEKGFLPSREKARRMIMAGRILVEGRLVDKAGQQVKEDARLDILEGPREYVSRGGRKLEGALSYLGVDPAGKVAMDVGASTGGFTDCLLKHGAVRVYAVDVGWGQLDDSLRRDERVKVLEKTNIRYLPRKAIEEEIDLAVIDTSFISLKIVLPKVTSFVRAGGEILALIKPQFELGPKEVSRGGVVRDNSGRQRAISEITEFALSLKMEVGGLVESEITGAKGNVEFFIHLKMPRRYE